ncbi:MAG: flagellar biosynthetic protein FliO [Succinivibrionaceae bacterium]|nr:flagellar biosynthetic protein FliO [Succinivibrionaceae bacterium]
MTMRFLLAFLLSVSQAFAADENVSATGMPAVSVGIFQWFLSCVAVIAFMFALLWLLKKTKMVPGGRHGLMQIVAVLSLGNHEKIMVTKAADRYFLLGVTSQKISMLAELDAASVEKCAGSSDPRKGFAAMMAQSLKRRAGADDNTDDESSGESEAALNGQASGEADDSRNAGTGDRHEKD